MGAMVSRRLTAGAGKIVSNSKETLQGLATFHEISIV
jgi:hypothetical protein